MEWTEGLKQALEFIEAHLLEEISVEDVAAHIYLSPFYFQKGFKLITGYTVGEYVRNRRLYLAALEIVKGDKRVIDLAYKYGYDTPESFSKAFTRLHGVSPIQVKEQPYKMKTFQPLQVSLSIKGADKLEYRIEKMEAFKIIGMDRIFRYDCAFDEIPLYWEEYVKQCMTEKNEEIRDAWMAYNIGVYGICIEEERGCDTFQYLIAGPYKEDKRVYPDSFKVITIPALTWAKFKCIGPMPETIQSLNRRIFEEWLPANRHYEIIAGYNIEVYFKGDIKSVDYISEIWIPVRVI